MKKILLLLSFVLLFSSPLYAVDTEVQDLTDITTPASGDDMYIVDDPDVTPLSRKINIGALLGVGTDLEDGGALSANTVDSSELVDGAVDLSHMSSASVDSDNIVDDTVANVDMADNSIDSAEYVDNSIDEPHINWGTGATQVSAVDIVISDIGSIITAIETEGALQENRTAIDLNTTHSSSDGSDHSFIDQNVTTTGSPTFLDTTARTLTRSPETDQSITAASNTISSSSSHVQINPDADYVMTGTPTITAGSEGQCMVLENISSFTIDLQDDSVLTGSDIFVGRAESTLVGGSIMQLLYTDSDGGGWRILSNPNTASLGADATLLEVRNETGLTLSAGVPVYVSGYNVGQGRPLVSLADADGSGTMPSIGVVSLAITTGTNGEVITAGSANNIINTLGQTINDPVYIGTTPGTLVFVKPTGASSKIQRIGTVARVHATSGVVLITGAGRQNDEENLADANIFIGDSSGNVSNVAMSGDVNIINDGTVTIQANSVALTTDTTGSYAAGDAEAGAALTGDAAVDFFGAGVDAVTDTTTCTDIEGTELSITAGVLNGTPHTPEGTAIVSTGETVGFVLQADGDNTSSWVALGGGGDALTANPLSQFAATTSLQFIGVISDETGTGLSVFNNGPTFIAPILGTPASGVATNLTGTASGLTAGNVTTNANLTGHVTSTGNAAILGAFTEAQLETAVSDDNPVFDGDIGSNVQAWDAELDTIAALTETNGNVMFVAGGVWTSDPTPAIDGTDITNVTAAHAGTITWTGTSILETGVAFQFGDASDATLTHTYGNTGTDVSIAYSTAAMAVTGALTATNLSGTNTGDEAAASATVSGIAELAIAAEIDTGTDSTRTIPVDQFVASKRNIKHVAFVLVLPGTSVATATNILGDFISPISGTILQSDTTPFHIYATNSTAGINTGVGLVVDVHLNGTTIMGTNKLDFDTTEKTTTTAATPPDLTVTALAVGDIITFDVDSIHDGTAAKGLTVYMAIRED